MSTRELVVTGSDANTPAVAKDLQALAQPLIEAWTAKMQARTDEYVKAAMEGVKKAEAGAWSGATYPWWNILVAGPYQPIGAAGPAVGPFLPHKVIQADDDAFMLGAVWMNPAPIGWVAPGPSAAVVMGAFSLTIRAETINLTTVSDGPDPAPIVLSPLGSAAGPLWFKPFVIPLATGFFPTPTNGLPNLYEMNVTADVSGPVALPFAGFSTWVFDPDIEPALFPPAPWLPPNVTAGWQHDIPARFLVYTA